MQPFTSNIQIWGWHNAVQPQATCSVLKRVEHGTDLVLEVGRSGQLKAGKLLTRRCLCLQGR